MFSSSFSYLLTYRVIFIHVLSRIPIPKTNMKRDFHVFHFHLTGNPFHEIKIKSCSVINSPVNAVVVTGATVVVPAVVDIGVEDTGGGVTTENMYRKQGGAE